MTQALPPKMHQKWGHLNELAFKGNGLWTSWCPNCRNDGHDPRSGPTDRFQIYEQGAGGSKSTHGWCRQCGHLEFPDDNDKPWSKQRAEEAKLIRRKAAASERKRIAAKILWLQQQSFWLEWHDNMDLKHKELWYKEGIGDWAITTHKLGYTDDRYKSCGGALTIPYLYGTNIQSLQLRLLNPPSIGDKYRFEKDITATWFRPWPEDEIEGTVLIVEGAKKAMVTWQLAGQTKYKDEELTIIATPAKHVPTRLFDDLKDTNRLIWMLDPDAYKGVKVNGRTQEPAITRNIRMAGKDNCLVVRTVAKIDDMFTEYKLKPNAFQNMVNQAGPWRVK